MESKTSRQILLAEQWFNSANYGSNKNMCGGVKAPPGFGKTRLVVEHILPKLTEATIIVPRAILRMQWRRILAQFEISNVQVYTVHELIAKDVRIHTATLIVDEVHLMYRSGDGKYVDYINGKNITFKNYLWLSATPFDTKGRHDEILSFAPIIGEVTRSEALENDWIADYTIVNLQLDLNTEDANRYIDLSNAITNELAKFGKRGYYLAQKCIRGGKGDNGRFYKGIAWATAYAKEMDWSRTCSADIDNLWNPNKIIGYARKAQDLINSRKFFLYEHPDKIDAIIRIMQNNDKLKSISFSRSTLFCDMLVHKARNADIKTAAIHSKMVSQPIKVNGKYITYKTGKKAGQPKTFGKKKLTEYILEQFKIGNLDLLSVGSGLDTGFDEESIRIGFNSSYTSNPNTLEQILGRVHRFISKDEPVLFVNIFFNNTIEENWLRNATANVDRKSIYWIGEKDIDDINFNIENEFD